MHKRVTKSRQEREALFAGDLADVERLIVEERFDGAAQLLQWVTSNFDGWFPGEPDRDIDHARRIGAAYWNLRFPVMAGRYWYLLDDVTGDATVARDEFERACGRNAVVIRASLPQRLAVHCGKSPTAIELDRRCNELRDDALIELRQNPLGRALAGTGCVVAALAVLFVFGVGLATLFDGK